MIKQLALSLIFITVLAAETDAVISNLSVTPRSPAVLISPYAANTPGMPGQAVKLTTIPAEEKPIIKYQPPTINIQNADSFSFYTKTDTYTQIEVAFEDSKGMTEFENINEYLPAKGMRKFWQKTIIPISVKNLKISEIKNIYFKIVTKKTNKKENIYLYSPIFEKTAGAAAAGEFRINDFENGIANRFNAEPKINCTYPSSINYTFDPEQKNIAVNFISKDAPSEIFIPILKDGKPFNAQEYTKLTFLIQTEKKLPLKIKVIHQNEQQKEEKLLPYYTRSFALKPLPKIWQNIAIPLGPERVALTGLLITFYPYTSGKISIDSVQLE